jgi:hypothetical protein
MNGNEIEEETEEMQESIYAPRVSLGSTLRAMDAGLNETLAGMDASMAEAFEASGLIYPESEEELSEE